MKSKEVILQVDHIKKQFPGVMALDDVSFSVYRGDVHAVVGENGAGKSTLIKIIAGAYLADEGTITIGNSVLKHNNPKQSLEEGIAVIYQELTVIPSLTIAENIYLGRQPINKGVVDWKKMYSNAVEVLKQLSVNLNPQSLARTISVSQQQIVEIARALSMNARIIIMDEPTASLTEREVQILFDVIRKLKSNGITIIYVSHRMKEIFQIADRITVLRDGKHINTVDRNKVSPSDVIRMMVGRDIVMESKNTHKSEIEALRVENLIHPVSKEPFSLVVNKGEILGLAGLMGSGRTEMVSTIFGLYPTIHGKIFVNGKQIQIRSPQDAIREGIGLVPENRKEQGLILNMILRDNLTFAHVVRKGALGLLDFDEEEILTKEYINKLQIIPPDPKRQIQTFSGGNQQKVVIGKLLALNPHVLILDEPTRGIDVGAKSEVHDLIRKLAEDGVGIIIVSSELPEILTLSDRVLVMYNGKILKELKRDDLSEENVMFYATGGI